MKTTENSINQKGCSVCKAGEENYTTFRPAHRPDCVFYQYDYRSQTGSLFSVVAPTLEECRAKRDKWVQANNYKRIFSRTLKKIENNKRLTKDDMAYEIGQINVYHHVSRSSDIYKRDEIVVIFNQLFGTEIK